MKEDVLEQIVDDYLRLNGYFTTHNVPFKPHTGACRLREPRGLGSIRHRHRRVPASVDERRQGHRCVMQVMAGQFQPTGQAQRDAREPAEEQPHKTAPLPRTVAAKVVKRVPRRGNESLARAHSPTASPLHCSTVRTPNTPRRCGRANHASGTTSTVARSASSPLEEMRSKVIQQANTHPAPSEIGRSAQLLKAARLQGEAGMKVSA